MVIVCLFQLTSSATHVSKSCLTGAKGSVLAVAYPAVAYVLSHNAHMAHMVSRRGAVL